MDKHQCPSRTNGTLEYFKCARWNDIKKRCINTRRSLQSKSKAISYYLSKNIKCEMTKDEFYNFCELNKEKIMSLFKAGEKPSVNRINPKENYKISNLEIISLSKNCSMQIQKTKPIIAINVITKEKRIYRGAFVKEIIKDGFDPSSVQKICKKTKNSGYLYKGWHFHYLNEKPAIDINCYKVRKIKSILQKFS